MNTQSLKSTALETIHINLGAKMVPFAGYNMPLQYSNLLEEHHCVRNNFGMFDVSHMGEFVVEGPQALDLLQWVTSNDVSALNDGKIQYSCFPNKQGGIVDDLLVYRYNTEKYLLVVNASNIDKDWEWINAENKFDCKINNISEQTSLIAAQGPKAAEALEKLTAINLSAMEYYTFQEGRFAGFENILISSTGYTGEKGFEIYCKNENAAAIWNAMMEAGKDFGVKACGLGARDTLRMEMGFCLYGHDINDTTSPIEAGLGWITKFNKDFVNKDFHQNIKTNGATKKLVGFEMIDRGIPRQHYMIEDAAGNTIGEVTSGTQSPSLGKAIGMGYVDAAFTKKDTEIFIKVRDKSLKAKVCKMPFLAK